LKTKLWLIAALFMVLGLLLVAQVKGEDFSWKDNFNYASVAEMQTAGWILRNPDGVSLQPNGVVIDGTKADTVIEYYNFTSGIIDWSVETRSMWLGVGHSGPGVGIITAGHSYGVAGDGWYDHFIFDRDGEAETFGRYIEVENAWTTMRITKQGNTVTVYFNGELIKTYIEQDQTSYEVTGVARIAPWHGVMLYDYYQVTGPDVEPASSEFSIYYFAVGGGIVAVVVAGAAVYYFFIAGKSAEAAATAVSVAGEELAFSTATTPSEMSAQEAELNHQLLNDYEKNDSHDDMKKLLESVKDQTTKTQMEIEKNKTDTQNKLKEQIQDKLKSEEQANTEVADSGENSGDAGT